MKSLSIASLTLVTFLSLAGCSNSLSPSSEELEKKSEKQEAIDNVCKYVTPSRISNINGVRIALARLVQIDGSYVPILEEVAEVISISLEQRAYPKEYPDLQLLKSFCSPLNK